MEKEKETKVAENEKAVEGSNDKKEITIKTAKGLVGEPFTSKDGKEYREVKIPNQDETDKSPWASFVVRANQIHEDKFSEKGAMWFKVPEDGKTTIRKAHITGQDENGKNVYENTNTQVSNTELKAMVEHYKTRDREQTQDKEQVADKPATEKSFKEQMQEAKAEAKEKNSVAKETKTKQKSKSKGQEI